MTSFPKPPKSKPYTEQYRRRRVRTLDDLQPLIQDGRYRIGPHALRHAACEGFSEKDMVAAALYGQELVRYLEDERLLALGYICPSPAVKIPLHVVLEFARPRWVDIVTAYIPVKAHSPVSRTRLAEILRYDQAADAPSSAEGGALGRHLKDGYRYLSIFPPQKIVNLPRAGIRR